VILTVGRVLSREHRDQEQRTYIRQPRDTSVLLGILIGHNSSIYGSRALLRNLLILGLLNRLPGSLLNGLLRRRLRIDKGTAVGAGVSALGQLLTAIRTKSHDKNLISEFLIKSLSEP
jgi:hypothetical protein